MRLNPFDAIYDLTWTCENGQSLMVDHYPKSIEDPAGFLEGYPTPPYQHYHSSNFIWVGVPGRMLRIKPNEVGNVHPVEGNIFYEDKLCAVMEAPSIYDFKIPLYCGYCEVYVFDCDDVLGAYSETYDLDYYTADPDDVGEIIIQLKDGNHRTIGALASDSDAFVQISDNQFQEYERWCAEGKPTSNVLLEWLDKNLI